MLINFNEINHTRLIVHKIEVNRETNSTNPLYSENVITVSPRDEIDLLLKKRLNESMNSSKAFDANIFNRSDDSVYSIIGMLYQVLDEQFVDLSKTIVDKLISCQKAKNIPGGHLIICEGEYNVNSSPQYIYSIFKSESHDAISFNHANNQLSILRDIILSPSQKLYKIGFFRIGTDIESAHVFDTSINTDFLPAKYFYSEFLGLDLANNAKIRTAKFYHSVEDFIYNYIIEFEEQSRLLSLLDSEIFNKTRPAIEPDFLKTELAGENLSIYLSMIADQFGNGFIKNSDLIQQKEKTKKITITKGITLIVSAEMIDKVQFSDINNNRRKIVTINE